MYVQRESQGKVRNDRQADKSGIIKIYCIIFYFLYMDCMSVSVCLSSPGMKCFA